MPVYLCPEAELTVWFTYWIIHPSSNRIGSFYLQPKKAPAGDIWHDNVGIGRDKLASSCEICVVKLELLRKRLTTVFVQPGASALFTAGVPEKLIYDVTRRRSNALHLYEGPSLQQ